MAEFETNQPSLRAKVYGYLQLLRLPNLFTAMADVTMGFLFVRGFDTNGNFAIRPEDGWSWMLLALASASLYGGGVVLNDVFDYEQDLEERPSRPLPSRRVSRGTARWLGVNLLLLGVLVGWGVATRTGLLRPGVVASLLAGCIVLYDAWAKRTVLGPIVMGGCRMLNVLLGMSMLVGPWQPEHWTVALGIGTYIAGVTWLARTEARRSRRTHLAGATVVMLCGIGILASLPRWGQHLIANGEITPDRWYVLMGFLGVMIGWRGVWAVVEPRPIVVQTAVSQAILSLVMLDAAACFAMCGMEGAILVLLFLVPTAGFGRFVRST